MIFTPSNKLTYETVQSNSEQFHKLMSQNPEVNSIRINLLDVTRCDSTGLALLIEVKRFCNKRQISLVMDNMSDDLSGLAKFCGVDTVLL